MYVHMYGGSSAPWIKDVWFFGTSYLIPNVDCVVLGGMNCTALHCTALYCIVLLHLLHCGQFNLDNVKSLICA
jgi:hypothetical protein